MIACSIDAQFREDKKALNRNFATFRNRCGEDVRYREISCLDDILECDVFVGEELKEGKKETGFVVTKGFLEGKSYNNVIALSEKFFTGTSYIVFFDIDNVDTFDSWQAARDFVEKTYGLKVAGIRKSSSGKDGKYHLFCILDKAIDIKLIKKYVHALTPGQERILIAKEGQRPRRETVNPYVDLKVYTAARLTYNMRSHGWLYRSDDVNKSTKITMGLNRIVPLGVKNSIDPVEMEEAKESHRGRLGVSKQEYNFMESSQLLHPDDVIFREGVEVFVGEAKKNTRYSFYPQQKSPSLHCGADGNFIDFEEQRTYKISKIYRYDKYISGTGSIFDFSNLSSVVIHAITGSGKTHVFEKPGFLIAVPRRSQTTIDSGLSTDGIIRECGKAVQFLTHDKLAAHIKYGNNFLGRIEDAGIKIVIDEAHTLTKGKKFKDLWELDDAIFLSGTVREYFRPDLEHVHFFRRVDTAPVMLCAHMPKIEEGKFLYFADRVNAFANAAPRNCLVAEQHYETISAWYGGEITAPKILTRNTFATSAYREGITLKTDGSRWSVIVDMNQCPTWSYGDAIQALWRIRGDDVDRYLILTTKEWNRLPTTKAFLPEFDKYVKWIKGHKITKETVLRGAGLNQNFSKMIYSPSAYSKVDVFGVVRNLDVKNAKVLPAMYTYEKYVGVYAGDPVDFEPINTIIDTSEEVEDDEVMIRVFEIANDRYECHVPESMKEEFGDWKDAITRGFMEKLEKAYTKCDGNLKKMHRSIKDGRSRNIAIKDLVKAMKRLCTIEIYHKDGRQMVNYSANVVKVKVLAFAPFEVIKSEVFSNEE